MKKQAIIRDCRQRMKAEQQQRNDPSIQKTKHSTFRSFAPCPQCQRLHRTPEKSWSGPNAANRPKQFKQVNPADNRKEGQE